MLKCNLDERGTVCLLAASKSMTFFEVSFGNVVGLTVEISLTMVVIFKCGWRDTGELTSS
jgi:hypothetical protein